MKYAIRHQWSFWPYSTTRKMALDLAEMVITAQHKQEPCCPKSSLIRDGFILEPKHYRWVLRFCSLLINNEDAKARKMILRRFKMTDINGCCFPHSGVDAVMPFIPFCGRDQIMKKI